MLKTWSKIFSLSLTVIVFLSVTGIAADIGEALPADGIFSGQKPGSVLFYNVYTSNMVDPNSENTKINITNTSTTHSATVHLFFIDGQTCGVADFFICMSPNLTYTLITSDYDPGISGYIIAVAVDGNGCPTIHNALIGDEYIRFASGHKSALTAESIAAIKVPECDGAAVLAELNFDGVQYDRVPSVLATGNIPSAGEGNSTLVVLNRPSGDLTYNMDKVGSISGLLYDDTENPYSFYLSSEQCQYKFIFSNTTPRTVPRFTSVISGGRTGWVKFFTTSASPLFGAVFVNNPAGNNSSAAFNGGHNMHALSLTKSKLTIPIFPTNCR